MSAQVPAVDCLVLDDGPPHLVGHRCTGCGATFLLRRNACGRCGGVELERTPLPGRGRVESFTVVHRGAPKATGPFISVLVRLEDGTYVKANLLGVPPEPTAVDHGAPVHLETFVAGTDEDGTQAVAFGFAYDPDGTERTA